MNSTQQNSQQYMIPQNQPLFTVCRQSSGEQFGPYDQQTIMNYVHNGTFSGFDLVWIPNQSRWVSINELTQPVYPQNTQNSHISNHVGNRNILRDELGFHPTVATFVIIVDLMIFGGTILSLGIGWVFLVFLALGMGYVAYNGQKNWYGDNEEDARTKAVMVAILMGIPVPLATALLVYRGIQGKIKSHKSA